MWRSQLAAAMLSSRRATFLTLLSAPAAPTVSPALCFAHYTKIIQKKLKSSCDAEPQTTGLPAREPLSPQQLERMARNKKAALGRLAAAHIPPGFGESWREGLSAEFGKPYFKQVRVVTPHGALLLCRMVLMPWFVSTADELCCRGEEETHRLPTGWTRLHLDSDVRHTWCRFNCDGTLPVTPKRCFLITFFG